jgi:hypothetical protein
VPIVIGTTGLEERHHWLIDSAADHIAVLQTGNTSLGVTLLAHLVHEAAIRLGEDWDIEIAEMHPFGLAQAKRAVNQTMDIQGFYNALQSVFDIHQTGHGNALSVSGYPILVNLDQMKDATGEKKDKAD